MSDAVSRREAEEIWRTHARGVTGIIDPHQGRDPAIEHLRVLMERIHASQVQIIADQREIDQQLEALIAARPTANV